jgi:hypothetical protein
MPFFLRFQSVKITAAMAMMTRAATPIPIPAFAPLDNPPWVPLFWFWVSPGAPDVGEGLDVEVVTETEEDVVVVVEDVDVDVDVLDLVVEVFVVVERCAGTAFLLTMFTPWLLSQHVTLLTPQQKLPS